MKVIENVPVVFGMEVNDLLFLAVHQKKKKNVECWQSAKCLIKEIYRYIHLSALTEA